MAKSVNSRQHFKFLHNIEGQERRISAFDRLFAAKRGRRPMAEKRSKKKRGR